MVDEEEKQEILGAAVNAAEEEEEDDGPPPGFQCILTPQSPPPPEKDDEEDDGPPPGFDCFAPKPLQLLPSSDMVSSKQDDIMVNSKQDEITGSSKQDDIMVSTKQDDIMVSSKQDDITVSSKQDGVMVSSKEDDMDDDDDGPPPGWEFAKLVNALPNKTSCPTDIKEESNEELDDGPPPGWESVLPCQMPQPQTPPLQLPSTVSSNSEMGSIQKTIEMDKEVPRSESEQTPTPGRSSPATPPPQQLPSSEQPSDAGNKEEDKKNEEKRPTSAHQPASPFQQLQSNPCPLTPAPKSSSEKAQLVCGTCRKLCLYPQGAKWVRCPGCQEVNFVLEAHEVGQVKCGGCTVLLMYPHGAPAVQCSSCRFVTEIGFILLEYTDGSAVAVNCCSGGWGAPGCGCGCPPVPKNHYYCQPAGCGGAGFTIYLGDNFPSAASGDDEQKP